MIKLSIIRNRANMTRPGLPRAFSPVNVFEHYRQSGLHWRIHLGNRMFQGSKIATKIKAMLAN